MQKISSPLQMKWNANLSCSSSWVLRMEHKTQMNIVKIPRSFSMLQHWYIHLQTAEDVERMLNEILIYFTTMAVVQWVRAFALQAESWVFESQPLQT